MATDGGRRVTLRQGDSIAVGDGRVTVQRIERRDGARVVLRLDFPPSVHIGDVVPPGSEAGGPGAE